MNTMLIFFRINRDLHRRKPGGGSHSGFTIVEIMVSLSIIAVLLSLSAPMLGRVREFGRRTSCMTNLRTFGQAIQMYRDDHEQALPFAAHFVDVRAEEAIWLHPLDALSEYLEGAETPHLDESGDVLTNAPFLCPSDPDHAATTGFSYDYIPSVFMPAHLYETGFDELKAAKRATVRMFDVAPYRWRIFADHGFWHTQVGPDAQTKKNMLRLDGAVVPGADENNGGF